MKMGFRMEVERPSNVKSTPKNSKFLKSPRALYSNRKFVVGGGDAPVGYNNLMYDKRVRRGSNFCRYPPVLHAEDSSATKAREARNKSMTKQRVSSFRAQRARLRIASPPPLEGRRRGEPVVPDLDLDDIDVDPETIPEVPQRDLWVEIPPSPIFIPAYVGFDKATQIYPGDMCDFDMDVQPILELLVGRTVVQAMDEVLREKELAELQDRQRHYLEVRASDAAEVQRLEEWQWRRALEKERRNKNHCEGIRTQREMEERIAAAVVVQGFFAELLPEVMQGFEERRFTMIDIEQNIEGCFMPWLVSEITDELQGWVRSSDVLCELVKDIVEFRSDQYRSLYLLRDIEVEVEEGVDVNVDKQLEDHLKFKEELLKRSMEND